MNAIQFQGELAKLIQTALTSGCKGHEVVAILESTKLDLYMHMRDMMLQARTKHSLVVLPHVKD